MISYRAFLNRLSPTLIILRPDYLPPSQVTRSNKSLALCFGLSWQIIRASILTWNTSILIYSLSYKDLYYYKFLLIFDFALLLLLFC